MNWKDIRVGDIISIRTNNSYDPQIITGKVTYIRYFNSQLDIVFDPLVHYFHDRYYSIRLKTQETYDGHHFKEYAINSLFCTLIDILKKGEITMPLEIGKQYKVKIPEGYSYPEQIEFTGELVKIETGNTLSHLIYSKKLEEQKLGHYGEGYTKNYGCWYCSPEWLEELEELEPTIRLEDLF